MPVRDRRMSADQTADPVDIARFHGVEQAVDFNRQKGAALAQSMESPRHGSEQSVCGFEVSGFERGEKFRRAIHLHESFNRLVDYGKRRKHS